MPSSSSSSSSNARVVPLNTPATENPLHSNNRLFKRLESDSATITSGRSTPALISPPTSVENSEEGWHTCCSSLTGRALQSTTASFGALGRALSGGARRILACRLSITVRFDTLVSLATFYVLLMDVIRLGVPKKHDPFLFGVTLAALVVLSLDFLLSLLAHKHCSGGRREGGKGCWYPTVCGYALSFRFWLDVLVLLSVVLSVCGVDDKVGSTTITSATAAHLSTTTQSMRLVGPSVLLATLHKFRLFRVIDRHVIPTGRGNAASSSSASPSSSSSPSPPSPSSASGSTPTSRSPHHRPQQQQQSHSMLSAGLAWVRGEAHGGGNGNSSSTKKSNGVRVSLLPRASISFVGRDQHLCDGGASSSKRSKDSNDGTNGGGRRGGEGRNGKPLEAELYDLTMHRLILTLFGALLMLALLNSNHARYDRSLPAATALLHAAQAEEGNGTMTEVVLTSYMDYFVGAGGGRGGGGAGGTLLSLQLGSNEETASSLLHDASCLALLRDSEIYCLQLLSFPPPPPPPVSTRPPTSSLPVGGGGGGGGAFDGVPPGDGGWEEEDLGFKKGIDPATRKLQQQQQQHQQLRLASDNGSLPIAFTAAIFDVSSSYRQRVLLEELYLPLFLAALLLLGAHAFSHDARRLIISPIDWIIGMVQKLAADPLGELELDAPSSNQADDDRHAQYETALIAASLKKITRLLRVGFGIAGADIITHNLDMNKPQAILNPLLPGKRVMAIMGFCDIHHFDFIVKHLEAEAMTFVNQVAAIVHENVSLWKGACNKNLGNSFLLMWRIGDEEKLLSVSRSFLSSAGAGSSPAHGPAAAGVSSNLTHLDIRRIPGVEVLADQALLGFLKVLVALKRDKKLQSLCADPRLQGKNGEPFELHMRFGLHAGWAIEGAVGSRHKVDATYLSPHVNLAARMETAATQYGVPVLMTDTFYQILSTDPRKRCRKLDVITVKGSATPRSIYTFDAHPGPLSALPSRSAFKTYSPDIWKKDKDILYLQESAAGADQFRSTFEVGLTNYINGLWVQAAECFRACDAMMEHVGGDGPSRTLLRYMQGREFKCPVDWEGFRPLKSK